MAVKVVLVRGATSDVDITETHEKANGVGVDGGHLLVKSGIHSVAIYAPGKWVSAEAL